MRSRRAAAVERVEDRRLGEAELRRVRAQVDALAPAPWTAVELSDLELHGPREWDPDVQPSREAHEREEQRRRAEAAWRGVGAADGTLVAGEPVRGGSPRPVVDPAWRFLADARTQVPQLLATLRPLWRLRDQQVPGRAEEDVYPPEVPASGGAVREVELERVAEVVYEAVPSPTRWRELPELVRDEWRARAEAAVAEVERQSAR